MITVENLSKTFPGKSSPVVALRDVSLDIDAGSLFGVVGPAASGKSTLARCLALQERPDRGVVRLDGVNTAALEGRRLREVRRQLAVVDPRTPLHAERTVAGNVAAPLERLGVAGPQRRSRVGTLLDLVGLTARATQQPTELTPGQRRRVEVARALAAAPAVLLADDPTGGVSPEEAGAVLTVLDRARAELGVTVVLATRDPGVVRRVCDGVAVLEQGTLVESGTVLGLLTDPGSAAARALLPAIDTPAAQVAGYDRVVDVVLVGFAAVGALLPEAATRFGVEVATIGGGLTRIGDTPVARFRLGLRGERADGAVAWVVEQGGRVTHQVRGPQAVVAA
ncbi:D-methionine transport system ATP-binding protein [Amycolatopsis arida]|uniref:D-methionine transport system ATP-binding protein n=1 Tax=Amycolatopsis arida TaxID=587909 RepID=A0A1I5Q2W2_9PSEU|nr:ATP-binding cassette domain-containing protein [Amycolatopsis arida]TDX98702.1 D-methionine transport system ATP-binding protein [Amycolatopsis arida]SFP40698.1 D-methionine transport system ATP-binding protein [Amycolatopsis arida]